ncbi:MAG: Rieske 2Fe-2S domain-containing protein [Acidimicrobiia bacterium]
MATFTPDTPDGPDGAHGDADERAASSPADERAVAYFLVLATVAALGLAGVYIAGGQAQAEGALLFVSLGSIGVALALWAKRLLPEREVTDERGSLPSEEADVEAVDETIGHEEVFFTERRLLLGLLTAAGGALGLAALFPIRSLGPSPGRSLATTAWRPGDRLVDEEGRPVRVDTLSVGGILTVFPEGREQAGDSQAVLIRVEEGLLRPRPARETWSPEGHVAYSKICTHVGCPVGLYQQSTHELLCPCHQSTFDVLDGARPLFGPATRSLPQLPLSIDAEGFLRADHDFEEPVGPGYWDRA